MNHTIHHALHNALLKLRDTDKSTVTKKGICEFVKNELAKDGISRAKTAALLYPMMWKWPECSDCTPFPVPSFYPNLSSGAAFWIALNNGALWDDTAPYGQARYRLLDFLIDSTKEQATLTAPIRQAALDIYKPPFKYYGGYVFDSNNKIVLDQDRDGVK